MRLGPSDAPVLVATAWTREAGGADPERAGDDALHAERIGDDHVVVSFERTTSPVAAAAGLEATLDLPSFERALALVRYKLHWTAPVVVGDPRVLPPACNLLLWRREREATFHAIVPLGGGGRVAELGAERFRFGVRASSHGPVPAPARVPLFAYGSGVEPHALIEDLVARALAAIGAEGRARRDKRLPAIAKRFGWCSWNAFGTDVTAGGVLDAVRGLREAGVPARWVLVDDGWMAVQGRKVAGLDADPKKIPSGLRALVGDLAAEDVADVGVWHTAQGYWEGVEAESGFADRTELLAGEGDRRIPDPRGGGARFWERWYAHLRASGISFVKVDNQSGNGAFTRTAMPLLDSTLGTRRQIETAAEAFFSDAGGATPVIDCMSMTVDNALGWRASNVCRSSDDYLPDDPRNVKDHIFQNAYNALWVAAFAWPDWDMFQSHDEGARAHAIARAVSGGPAYVTDVPGKSRPDVLRPLVLSDGRIAGVDAPGRPTAKTVLRDPSLEAIPLEVVGPVARPGLAAAAIGVFHVCRSAPRVRGSIRASDAASLPREGRFLIYRGSTGEAVVVADRDTAIDFELEDSEADVFTIVAIDRGAAVIGLVDKHVPPSAIDAVERDGDALEITMRDGGELAVWTARAGVVRRRVRPDEHRVRVELGIETAP